MNIDFTEYELVENPHLTGEMVGRSNGGTTVPQIFIDDEHIGGSTDFFERISDANGIFWHKHEDAA